MASDSKWHLVCYDVRNEKRLRKVAKHLEGYGSRVQYSVFRCHLNPTQVQQLRWELTQRTTAEDDVIFIPICNRCVAGLSVTHSTDKRPHWRGEPDSYRIV